MIGSWVGVMGYIQFILMIYLVYVVDFIGDGWCDIWLNDFSDLLVLIVNYLVKFGWQCGLFVVVEVMLLLGFNIGLGGKGKWCMVLEW